MKGTNIETLVGKRFGEGVVTHVEKYEAREGTDVGQIYKIDFEISYGGLSHINNTMMIPERWNERFVGIGNGGIAGILGTGWYCFAENGYAAVQSDLGTSAVRRGEIVTAYEGLWADYGHRAVHGSTMVAKAILEYVKGKPPVYSYFYGASAGGKSALSEVQRHPNDYDGVVAGVPSNNGLAFVTYLLWCYRRLGGDKGQPLFGEKLSQKINDCAVEFCKAHGDAGEPEDDFMTFPYYGKNTVAEFIDYLKIKLPELNKEQLEALEAVYTGPKNPRTGEQIFCGMPIGSELNTGYFLGDGITCGFDLPW
jgi:feruloyl esterase